MKNNKMRESASAPPNRKYRNVKSSGYLAPNYRYRTPPAKMSWLEDDFDLINIEGESRPKSPEPQLDDFIHKVLQAKRVPIRRKKENAYKSALYLASNIVEAAFEMELLYARYIRNTDRKPDICDFRAVDKNVYVGIVPLRKPVRIDSLVVAYMSPGDLPTHRMLVHINKSINKEERTNVIRDWGHCLDAQGFLRPDFILSWFNTGLIRACKNMEVENKRTQKLAFLETSLSQDGTIWIHVIGFDSQENYKINIVPCLPISEVPKQLKLIAPIPSRRPFSENHGKFLRDVNDSIHAGEEILFLEARLEKWSKSLRCNPILEVSWGVHVGQIEDRAFRFLNSLTPTKIFEEIIYVINAIKEEHAFCLHTINNRVINHALFFQFRKNFGKLTRTQDWLLAVLEFITLQMRSNVFPNFFLQKQDIFMETNNEVIKFNEEEMKRLVQRLKNDPASLIIYSGCEELEKNEDKSDNENSQHSDDNGDSTLDRCEKIGVHFED